MKLNLPKTALAYTLLLFSFICLSVSSLAQPGKDNAATVSTTNAIFNRYAKLTASTALGATRITVSNIADLYASAIPGAANNPYTADLIAYGDLIMVIKMQGASMDVSNSSSYGTITSYNGVGNYEVATVMGISGNDIYLCSGLVQAFTVTATERVQVVRIPRLNNLTVITGASLIGKNWDALSTGGIVAVEVTGNAVVDGAISANDIGFIGGVLENFSRFAPYTLISDYKHTLATEGAEKGEGIGGNAIDYHSMGGRYNRGAPANGGGGGNAHNAGGGGGANGGNVALWTGFGNPDLSGGAIWVAAWELESAGFSSSSSSGGGRGGYTYLATLRDPTVNPPGDTLWGGGGRQNIGGFGGHPLVYSASTLFMGGGGGAGDGNNSSGSAGGNGGGILYLTITGNLSGIGSLTANGASTLNTSNENKDGTGGGGGGGAIKLNVQGTISGVGLAADGGKAGDQNVLPEAEGTGGGGGGGYISFTEASYIANINGGANGITLSNRVPAFRPNGATRGGGGSIVMGQSFVSSPGGCVPLPVSLTSFTVVLSGIEQVKTTWSAVNENDVLRYEVQLSNDGSQWQTLSTTNARSVIAGVQTYTTTFPARKENFQIRIRIINDNGTINYSPARMIRRKTETNAIAQNEKNVFVYTEPGTHLSVYSLTGQVMESKHITRYTTIIDIDAYAPGVYYIKLKSADGPPLKFIKH